jgi:YegS/Rv2252/BmrU family lipid kinase
MSVAVIINPKSGPGGPDKGVRRAALAAEILAPLGEDYDISVTTRRGHARELAADAVARGARLVVAWGGDGTINEVGSSLIFTGTALGIVRSGSGNSLARELKVNRRPATALREALAATPRRIDAGEIGGHVFFCVAGLGFDEHVAACFDRDTSGRRGFSTYIRLALREIFRYTPDACTVGETRVARAMLVAIANTAQFGNGAVIAPDARVDDGRLNVVMLDERSRLATMLALPRLYLGGLRRVRGVTTQSVERIAIESRHPIRFHADGEPMTGSTRLEVRVLPGALRVAVR